MKKCHQVVTKTKHEIGQKGREEANHSIFCVCHLAIKLSSNSKLDSRESFVMRSSVTENKQSFSDERDFHQTCLEMVGGEPLMVTMVMVGWCYWWTCIVISSHCWPSSIPKDWLDPRSKFRQIWCWEVVDRLNRTNLDFLIATSVTFLYLKHMFRESWRRPCINLRNTKSHPPTLDKSDAGGFRWRLLIARYNRKTKLRCRCWPRTKPVKKYFSDKSTRKWSMKLKMEAGIRHAVLYRCC